MNIFKEQIPARAEFEEKPVEANSRSFEQTNIFL